MANKMKPLKWKEGCENLYQSLGISQTRADDLEYRLQLIVHEVTRPVKKGEEGPSSDSFIKMCIGLAETEEERVFCAYVAGLKIKDIWNTDEEEIYDEDDEDFYL